MSIFCSPQPEGILSSLSMLSSAGPKISPTTLTMTVNVKRCCSKDSDFYSVPCQTITVLHSQCTHKQEYSGILLENDVCS